MITTEKELVWYSDKPEPVTHYYCDECGKEKEPYKSWTYQLKDEILYINESGDELCLDCAFNELFPAERVPDETACDCCGDEYYAEELRDWNGRKLCKSCVADRLVKVRASIWI